MPFNSPISAQTADQLIQRLNLRPAARALDAGCGTGEFLLRVVTHHNVHGLGIDQDPRCIAAAQASASARGLSSHCHFRAADVNQLDSPRAAFDLALCIGSTHAFGSADAAYPNAISRLSHLVQPGGYLLIGECYWKQPPAPEYLQLIGDPVGIYHDHTQNISFAQQRGLTLLQATVSTDDEWDDFENRHHHHIQREAEANPHDPALAAKLIRGRQWHNGYLRWGKTTMGFGLYLFCNDPPTQLR